MGTISKDELNGLKRGMEREHEPYTKEAKIFYDKRQYSVRIPAKIAKVMGIDGTKDKILFSMRIPSRIEEKPTLEIKLIQDRA